MGRALKNARRGGNTQKSAPNPNPQIGNSKAGGGGMKRGAVTAGTDKEYLGKTGGLKG